MEQTAILGAGKYKGQNLNTKVGIAMAGVEQFLFFIFDPQKDRI